MERISCLRNFLDRAHSVYHAVALLAETLKALPVFSRRTSFAVGIQYVITALALGKSVGALVYFWNGLGA